MTRYRYRQLFLFLVVLILPVLGIAIQGRRIATAEQELADQQSEKLRKETAAEVRKDLADRLDRTKLQAINSALSGGDSNSVPSGAYSDPAIAFVGWEEGGELVWPWDAEPRPGKAQTVDETEYAQNVGDPVGKNAMARFSSKMNEAERKFDDMDYPQAVALSRAAIDAAHSESEKASAHLLLGRALSRSGGSAEALRVYRQLLNLPPPLTDEHGLSFSSYAAARLVESHAASTEVLESMSRHLESPGRLTPFQAYRIRFVLDALRKSGDDAVRDSASAAMERLSVRLKDLDQAWDVQKDFQKRGVTAETWRPFAGNTLWWIGKAPMGGNARPLILAVRFDDIRRGVETAWLSRHPGSPIQITARGDSGEPLGAGFPGLFVVFGPGTFTTELAGPQSFYGLSLFFVVTLTFVGAFFLWRDTRRETRIAELRSQFVSSVSHELKTPLTSIRMFAETLQMNDEAETPNPKMRGEYLDTIVNETERLTRLLNNVLDFSRIERGQKNYHMESALLPDVIDAAVRTMRFPLAEQGFVLKVDISDGIPPLYVDRDALEQAVLNLLSNAMKYSGKSRGIELRLCRQNGSALIQVSDHGIGIPAEEQRRIFEKFYRVPAKENKAISGTGLGLALVAHIAEAHGGVVEVHSSPGEGSTFSIQIPMNRNGAS